MQSGERALSDGVKHFDIRPATAGSNQYFIPPSALLKGLGIEKSDLEKKIAPVNMEFLNKLIREFAKNQSFDQKYYSNRYPDIEGARLAGVIKSTRDHFINTGYLEGRLPRELPFDANWYYNHYKDLSSKFQKSDTDALRDHFLTTGYSEGRAGTAATLAEAEEWHIAK